MSEASRLKQIYSKQVVPTVDANSLGDDGLPHTPDGILKTVEKNWLGAEGAVLVQRRIDNGILTLDRPNYGLSLNARTKDGIPCPFVWGVSIEGATPEEDIIEPHLLVPEGAEIEINVVGQHGKRNAILGIFDQENDMPGLPPVRTPLLAKDGRAEMYAGDASGKNMVVFWNEGGGSYGLLRAVTPVKQEGGALALLEEGSREIALHGGLYLIVVPGIASETTIEDLLAGFDLNIKPGGYGGRGALADYGMDSQVKMGGGDLFSSRSFDLPRGDRAGGIKRGETAGKGGMIKFEPDAENIVPFLFRIRVTGGQSGYLDASSVATNADSQIHVKGAICAHCGINAPKSSYTWTGTQFHFDSFECNGCGGGTLEPVQYKRSAPKAS